jgi:hypothetical protein
MGGSLTYHQPDMGMKLLNYGFNVDFLSNQYGDFFIWRSPTEVYKPSPFTNMGREENNFHIDPFINYVNPENGTSHKIKGRFYYSADNIVRPTQGTSITDILGNMGTDAKTIQNIAGGDYSSLYPALVGIGSGLVNGNLEDAMNGVFTSLGNIFPNATTADYCDRYVRQIHFCGSAERVWQRSIRSHEECEDQRTFRQYGTGKSEIENKKRVSFVKFLSKISKETLFLVYCTT